MGVNTRSPAYGRDGKPGGEGYDADISTSTLEQRYVAGAQARSLS